MVTEWIERAERHWRNAEQFADLPVSYQSGMLMAQLCLETYRRAALIAQGVDSRKCRDLQMLSDRLRYIVAGQQLATDAESGRWTTGTSSQFRGAASWRVKDGSFSRIGRDLMTNHERTCITGFQV